MAKEDKTEKKYKKEENGAQGRDTKRAYQNDASPKYFGSQKKSYELFDDNKVREYMKTLFGEESKEELCPECKQLGRLCQKHVMATTGAEIADIVADEIKGYVNKEIVANGKKLFYATLAYAIARELDKPQNSYSSMVLRELGAMYAQRAGLDPRNFGVEHSAEGYTPSVKEAPANSGGYKNR